MPGTQQYHDRPESPVARLRVHAHRWLVLVAACAVLVVAGAGTAQAARVDPGAFVQALGVYEVVYPKGSGVINVKDDYGARGDGTTDDTQAIKLALKEAGDHPRPVKPVFLPAGTYLVSDTILRKNSNGLFVGDPLRAGGRQDHHKIDG